MTAKSNVEMGAVCLGYAAMAATWWRMTPSEDPMKKGWLQQPQITIMVAETTDENGYTPASSVNISGVEALHALRSTIDEALKYEMPKTGAQPAPNLPVDLITDYLVSISVHVAHQDDQKAQAEIGELLRMLAAASESRP